MFETGEQISSHKVPGKLTIAIIVVFFAIQLSLEWFGLSSRHVLIWLGIIMAAAWEDWEVVKQNVWIFKVLVALALIDVPLIICVPWHRLSHPDICEFFLSVLNLFVVARSIAVAKKATNSGLITESQNAVPANSGSL